MSVNHCGNGDLCPFVKVSPSNLKRGKKKPEKGEGEGEVGDCRSLCEWK